MTDTEIIWLAGLLEGEGIFGAYAQGRSGLKYPLVRVQMVDRDVIGRAACIFDRYRDNGKASRISEPKKLQEHYQQTYAVTLSGWPAIDLMRDIRPWMGERRSAKIDELVTEYGDRQRRKAA